MNSPQIENGHTRIANELLEAVTHFDFTKRQYKILLAVIRKTYGYSKKEDDIGISQLAKMTGLKHTHAALTVRELVEMGVLKRRDGNYAHVIGLVKDYAMWSMTKTVTPTMTETVIGYDQNSHSAMTKTVTPPMTKTVTTKENQPKENPKRNKTPLPPQLIPNNKSEKEKRGGGDFLVDFIFPSSLSHTEQQAALQMLGAVNGSAQKLLDTLEAAIQAGQVKKNPLALLGGMIRRYEAGTFDPAPGLHIAAEREKRLTTRRMIDRQTNVDGDAVLREIEALTAAKLLQNAQKGAA
jgi:phage replication O-like protein O